MVAPRQGLKACAVPRVRQNSHRAPASCCLDPRTGPSSGSRPPHPAHTASVLDAASSTGQQVLTNHHVIRDSIHQNDSRLLSLLALLQPHSTSDRITTMTMSLTVSKGNGFHFRSANLSLLLALQRSGWDPIGQSSKKARGTVRQVLVMPPNLVLQVDRFQPVMVESFDYDEHLESNVAA